MSDTSEEAGFVTGLSEIDDRLSADADLRRLADGYEPFMRVMEQLRQARLAAAEHISVYADADGMACFIYRRPEEDGAGIDEETIERIEDHDLDVTVDALVRYALRLGFVIEVGLRPT